MLTFGRGYCGPICRYFNLNQYLSTIRELTCWTQALANACPAKIESSRFLPATRAPTNPPAKASPAPLVSTIWLSVNGVTGNDFGLSGSSELTTTVFWAPWVNMTTRERERLDLGRRAMERAIAGRSLTSGKPVALAQASASDSFPMIKSV